MKNYRTAFEVKTGKNKGFYIVTKAKHLIDSETFKTMADCYGMLVYDYNSDFYKYHKVDGVNYIIWTHSRFAGHEFNRMVFKKLLKELEEVSKFLDTLPL